MLKKSINNKFDKFKILSNNSDQNTIYNNIMDLTQDNDINDYKICRTSIDLIDNKTDHKQQCDLEIISNSSQDDLLVSNR